MLRISCRVPLLMLCALGATSLGSCSSQDSEEAILADCSQQSLSSSAAEDCLGRARVMEATYPSPRLEALIAALGATGPGQVAELPPPPPDEAPPYDPEGSRGDQHEDFDATATPPDYADADAPPADEDLEGGYAFSQSGDTGQEDDRTYPDDSEDQPLSDNQSQSYDEAPEADDGPPPSPPN